MINCPLFGFWVWILVILGYQISHQRFSTILMLILVSLVPALYNCNFKSNRLLCKSFPYWISRGTFWLYPCRVGFDQQKLKTPNAFSLLLLRGSLPHPPNIILFLCWWIGYSAFFDSCGPSLLRVSFWNICWFLPPWYLDKLWGGIFNRFEEG